MKSTNQLDRRRDGITNKLALAQSAAVMAEIGRMKDLFVSLDKDNTIRDCQSTSQIHQQCSSCCLGVS